MIECLKSVGGCLDVKSLLSALNRRVDGFLVCVISLTLFQGCKTERSVKDKRSGATVKCAVNGASCDAERPVMYLQGPGDVSRILVAGEGIVAQEPAKDQAADAVSTGKMVDMGTGPLTFVPLTFDPLTVADRPVDLSKPIGRFLRKVEDSDRLLVESLRGTASVTTAAEVILSSRVLTLGRGEFLIVRSALPVAIDDSTREACKGGTLSTAIQIAEAGVGKGKPVTGKAMGFGNKRVRLTAAGAFGLVVQDGGQYSFELTATGVKPGCQLNLLEPATLTVFIFSPLEYFKLFEKSAKFLVDVDLDDGAVNTSGEDGQSRINTMVSGPPVVTLRRKDIDLTTGDIVLVAGSVEVVAEDRIGETSAWMQVTRSPSGLNSHLNVQSLAIDGGPDTLEIFDWAPAAMGPGKMRFYLNLMGTSENSKPVEFSSPKVRLFQFGSIAPNGSLASLALDAPSDAPEVPYGRWVDLLLIRSQMARGPVPPAEDSLECPLFNVSRGTGMTQISGLNGALKVPTPVHHSYRTRWVQGGAIVFSIVAYEDIYGGKMGDPVWTLQPPPGRESHYTKRFYEVTVSNPAQAACRANAARQ